MPNVTSDFPMSRRRKNKLEIFGEDEKCAKHEAKLAAGRAHKDEEREEESFEYEEAEREEDREIPFESVLADKRRKYSLQQEYVYLIYNDLIQYFVTNWEGTYLRNNLVTKKSTDESSRNEEESYESSETADGSSKSREVSNRDDWMLFVPDEQAEIIFINKNSYTGRISRKKMEGRGIYSWRNGSQYEGDFEDNKIQGKGRIEWQDGSWYEGNFQDGYRHGHGTLVNKDYNILYIGQWKQGRKHGNGYCRLEEDNSYDGDWINDRREGVGNYIYPNGSRYIGNWKEDLRHGTGTMIWPNGDVYRGEWKNGEMHGYGEYTWSGFFNNTLSWPHENCYMGEWYEGTRHGEGQITLNSVGGARYSGEWRNDKKHGKGLIIGNNGEVTEGDPLFENDILLPGRSDETSEKIPRITTVSKPEQCISLRHYIDRLRVTNTCKSSASRVSLIPEKCGICENNSCRCIQRFYKHSGRDGRSVLPKIPRQSTSNSTKNSSLVLTTKCEETKVTETSRNLEREKYWTYDCISTHMPRIRKIYDNYSRLFGDPANCRFSMSRLSLWQLWRDCDIHRKAMSLAQIDKYLAINKCTLMKNPSCPFERIEIWQLLHALLEVSWHFYTKNDELDVAGYPGKLANGLNKFLINDIYPNAGKYAGTLCGPERDLVSLYSAYKLYRSVGQSHPARKLLTTIFSIKGTREQTESLESSTIENNLPVHLPDGQNAVLVGDRLMFLPKSDKASNHRNPCIVPHKMNIHSGSSDSLHVFQGLGTKAFLQIMSVVCPSIRDPESGVIINMEYELTFLEFFEILIEAAKQLTLKRKMRDETIRENENNEKSSIDASAKDVETKDPNVRLSGASKMGKSKKRTRNTLR